MLFFILHRPTRMSAPTDADVCTDRRGCLHRPMRMLVSTDADAELTTKKIAEGFSRVLRYVP
ncbi:hypothetical protein [Leyella stercorea]|uniref:hypothetical protein n=1 Tax=Leyella stercorea TaxID=363265 RepID=UPI00242D70AE|nr:hypothetical protein [Leyella stercorea]